MKETLKLYWKLSPFFQRWPMYCLTLLGGCIGILGLTWSAAYEHNISIVSLGNAGYFLVLTTFFEFNFMMGKKEGSLFVFLHQIPKQKNFYNKGVIVHLSLLTILELLVGVLTFILLSYFIQVSLQIIIIWVWCIVLSGIYSMYMCIAYSNGKRIIGNSLFFFCLLILVCSLVLTQTTVIAPTFFQVKSLLALGVVVIVFVSLAYLFGNYCYRTRHELNEKAAFKKN